MNDFVDLAIWVNRDDTKGVDLAKLFEGAANDSTTRGALTVLGGLVLAAPQGARAVGTVAAVATVVGVGSELVQAAVGKEIGLYRTSCLAFEKYGVGRQPVGDSARRKASSSLTRSSISRTTAAPLAGRSGHRDGCLPPPTRDPGAERRSAADRAPVRSAREPVGRYRRHLELRR